MPRRATRALLIFFPSALLAAFLLSRVLLHLDALAPKTVWEWLHVIEIHIALSLAYIVIYSALEQDSPSLTILKYLAEAGNGGRSRQDLHAMIGDEFIDSRLVALRNGGMLLCANSHYQLTLRGKRWAWLFARFRKLYGLPLGG
jgi:hypothetical protein